MEAGLNLYSIRGSIKTEPDFLETAKKVKEMGYSYLQYSGGPFDPEMIRRVSEETGLPVCLTHVPADRILNDTEQLMADHAVFGCKNIGLGAMPTDVIADETRCKEMIEKLDAAGEKMLKNGFKFFYHHHHYEFFKHNGETVFDYILKNTSNINFIIDTYWLQFAGVSVLDYIKKVSGRMECIHLKDYTIAHKILEDNKHKYEPVFCPVGDGTIDFKAVVKAAKESGAKYFLVEQDNATTHADPFGQVERSINYIRSEL